MIRMSLLFAFLFPTIGFCHANEWDGKYYSNHSQMQFEIAISVLKEINISPDAKILDIGCGDGQITEVLASLVPQGFAVGMDNSSSMIAQAATRQKENLTFVWADAAQIRFTRQFDCIVSFNCLHWVTEIREALSGIHASLLPGGQALLLLAPVQPRHLIHRIINHVAHNDPWRSYFEDGPSLFKLYTFSEWASLAEQSGLVVEKCQLVPIRLDYKDVQAFADWLAGWIPYGAIPNDERSRFIREIAETYVRDVPCESDGTVHFLMDELLIQCTRN